MHFLLCALVAATAVLVARGQACQPGSFQCCGVPSSIVNLPLPDGTTVSARARPNGCYKQVCQNGVWGNCAACSAEPDVPGKCFANCNPKPYNLNEDYFGVFDSCNTCRCVAFGDFKLWMCTLQFCEPE